MEGAGEEGTDRKNWDWMEEGRGTGSALIYGVEFGDV